MPNPKVRTLTINGVTYELQDNTSGYTTNQGTVTSVQVQATSPVQSSQSSAQSISLATTISLADAYGDTKNPYGNKTKNYVLAAPSNAAGAPTFRALVASDIPDLSDTYLTSIPTETGSRVTGISVADHETSTIFGVKESTTSVRGVTGSTAIYGVKSGANSLTTASKVTSSGNGSASTWVFEEISIPNVTSVGTASSWVFEEKSIPNVTSVGTGSLVFAIDEVDEKKLVITHTHVTPILGNEIKVQSKKSGDNGTAPTTGTDIKVQSKKSGDNGTAPSWAFTTVDVPIRAESSVDVPTADANPTIVPVRNDSSTVVVTSKTHSVTDSGHTHTI